MTRQQLRHLEGQRVVWRARLQKRIHRPDGLVDLCLAGVEVRPLSTTEPLDRIEPARVDHLWLRGPVDACDFGEMLMVHAGTARCGWYARSNGSVDLGLEAAAGLDLDEWTSRALAYTDDINRMGAELREVLRLAEKHPAYSWRQDPRIVLRNLRRWVQTWERSVLATTVTGLTSTANGRCRGLDLLQVPSGSRRRVAGFA